MVKVIHGLLADELETGSGSGSGDGSGSGSGDGSGYGSGCGDGSSDRSSYGDGALVLVARSQLPESYRDDPRVLALWKSNAAGRPANGGVEVRSASPGLRQEAPGPLKLCTAGCLHATLRPSSWQGDRVWIVALEGDVVGDTEKMGALKREIICEVKLG